MRTEHTLKIITITLIVLALMSATAFAYVGKPAAGPEASLTVYQEKNSKIPVFESSQEQVINIALMHIL
jgi:flagellar basal body-associated protein FliL